MIIKQTTAYSRLFIMVQSSDHVTPLTGASPVVKLSKAGAAGVTAQNSPAVEVDSTNVPGLYRISLGVLDTNTAGDLAFHCTAASGDPTDFIDQVQSAVFTDLNINSSTGRVLIQDNITQNAPFLGFQFLMIDSITGAPKTGLTVTAQRSLAGAGFGPCANPVTEISNGIYSINLAATDLNAPTVMLRFTATGASDLDINLVTQP